MNTEKVNCKQNLSMSNLSKFFCSNSNMNQMLPIVNGESPISLRVIDWFVTNFSKKNNIVYDLKKNNEKKQFNVYLNYKSQLKAYSKKQFDPFCRRERISFFYDDEKEIITTVGQLNFFRWAIDSKVLDYIKNNLIEIENDMNISVRNIYNSKKVDTKTRIHKKKKLNDEPTKKTRKKRHELSVSATKSVNKHFTAVTVQFE